MPTKPSKFKSFFLINPIQILMRFPLAVGGSLAAAILALVMIHSNWAIDDDKVMSYMLAAVLVYVGSITIQLIREVFEKNNVLQNYMWQLLALLPAGWLVISAHLAGYTEEVVIILFFFLVASLIFLAFGSVAINNTKSISLWQFAVKTILSVIFIGLSMLILFAAAALALFSIEQLFDVNVTSAWYETSPVLIFLALGPLLFLAHIQKPEEVLSLTTVKRSEGLKRFTWYVLVPIISVYFAIIYAYAAKILFQWELPAGEVARPIGFYTVAVLAVLLLSDPLQRNQENEQKLWWYKALWASMLPMMVLFIMALYERIVQYGLTEIRYLGVWYVVWIMMVSVYFLLSKAKQLRIIPFSLAIIFFIGALPGVGAEDVALHSQVSQLEKLASQDTYTQSEKQQIYGIQGYLTNRDALSAASAIEGFPNSDEEIEKKFTELHLRPTRAEEKGMLTGTNPVYVYLTDTTEQEGGVIDVSSYEFAYRLIGYRGAYEGGSSFFSEQYNVGYTLDSNGLTIQYPDGQVVLSAQEIFDAASEQYFSINGASANGMYVDVGDTVTFQKEGIKVTIMLSDLSMEGNIMNGAEDVKISQIQYLEGMIFIDLR